jgi:hypothetical protein
MAKIVTKLHQFINTSLNPYRNIILSDSIQTITELIIILRLT